MMPPYAHISLEVLLRAGLPPTSTVGDPGAQGAGITGMQGMGVRTPIAAAVAEATAGLAGFVHIPKGMTFTSGILSMIVATGVLETTLATGRTLSVDGAIPKLHTVMAPPQTQKAIFYLLSSSFALDGKDASGFLLGIGDRHAAGAAARTGAGLRLCSSRTAGTRAGAAARA